MDEKRQKRHHDLLEWVEALAKKNVARQPQETGNDWWQRVIQESGIDLFSPYEGLNTGDDWTWWELILVWGHVLDLEYARYLKWMDWVDEHYPTEKEAAHVDVPTAAL